MDPNAAVHQPMVTDESHDKIKGSNSPLSSDNMDISVVFKEIVSRNPPRYTEFCEAVNMTFKEINESISPEDFKNILGNISFLSQKNAANLLSTLKTQLNNQMGKYFQQVIENENLSELFERKNSLDEETAKKYFIDDDSMELIKLEETLSKLDVQIAEAEEANEYLFDQEKFNYQRFDQLSERITKLKTECQTKYSSCVQQSEVIKKEFINMLKDQ